MNHRIADHIRVPLMGVATGGASRGPAPAVYKSAGAGPPAKTATFRLEIYLCAKHVLPSLTATQGRRMFCRRNVAWDDTNLRYRRSNRLKQKKCLIPGVFFIF